MSDTPVIKPSDHQFVTTTRWKSSPKGSNEPSREGPEIERALPSEASNPSSAPARSREREEGQKSAAHDDTMDAAAALLSISATGVATPADAVVENDKSQSVERVGSEGWEDTESSDDTPLAQLRAAPAPNTAAGPSVPRLRSEPVFSGSEKKGIVPPVDAVWSVGTMAAKSNRPCLLEWLEMTHRDSSQLQYQGQVGSLYREIHRHMVDDAKERKLAQKAMIAQAKQMVKAKEAKALEGQKTANVTAGRPSTIKAGKRKRRDEGFQPVTLPKKTKTARRHSSHYSDGDLSTDPETSDETELGFDTENDNELLELQAEAEADTDSGIQDTSLSEASPAVQSQVATLRKDLEDIKKAALDSLQLRKNYKDQAQDKETRNAQAPHRYSEYAYRNPQLILQAENGKPVLDYETQVTVGKIMKGRANLLARMRAGNATKTGSPFDDALRGFKRNCRSVSTRIGKVIRVMDDVESVHAKDWSKMIINDLFARGIPRGELG